MRKILIVIHSFEPFSDSNTNALLPLLPLLTQDYEVDILCANKNNVMKWRDKVHDCRVFRYSTPRGLERSLLTHSLMNNSKLGPRKPRLVLRALVRNTRIVIAKTLAPAFPHWDYVRLKRLVGSGDYAAIVTVTSPIRPQFLALRLHREGLLARSQTVWIPWFMDPYSTYIGHSTDRAALVQEELSIYEAATLVIVTPELGRDNVENEFAAYRNKTRIMPLANLRAMEGTEETEKLDAGVVNFLYSGSLQDVRVRNPTPLFRLISKSPQEFLFHMLITTWSRDTEALRDKYLTVGNQVQWYDPMPLEEALALNRRMDVLINIGNECSNQLPGKCYDLVGTGLPIVNIYSRDDDTSHQFLHRYPLYLGIQLQDSLADDGLLAKQVERLATFVRANRGRHVPSDVVECLYGDFLPEAVYAKFRSVLTEAISSG